jgi:hypothetical protein
MGFPCYPESSHGRFYGWHHMAYVEVTCRALKPRPLAALADASGNGVSL